MLVGLFAVICLLVASNSRTSGQEFGAAGATPRDVAKLMSLAQLQMMPDQHEQQQQRRNWQIRTALMRLLAPTDHEARLATDDEWRIFQKKADPTAPAGKEIENLVESAMDSANKYTRDPSKYKHQEASTAATSQPVALALEMRPDGDTASGPGGQAGASGQLATIGQKNIRTDHPIFMRLPPRFGKRSLLLFG